MTTATLTVYEYEAWLSTSDGLHAGVTVLEVRKIVVAARDDCEGYKIAMDMAWRGNWQVTKLWYVP